MTATLSTIRDRIYTLIEGVTPTTLSADKLDRYRNEGGADFRAWAETNPTACLRRFQVRDDGVDDGVETSDVQIDLRHVTIQIIVAYPQTGRYGEDQAMARDKTIDQDYNAINYLVGIYGRGNFSSTHDCTPLGAPKDIERGDGVDFLVMNARYSFYRSVT